VRPRGKWGNLRYRGKVQDLAEWVRYSHRNQHPESVARLRPEIGGLAIGSPTRLGTRLGQ